MFGPLLLRRLPVVVRRATNRQFSTSKARTGGGEWTYRAIPPPAPRGNEIAATAVMTFAWWWMLYGCMTDYHHIIGSDPFGYPNPDEWTDEELGIPPDDYEE